MKNIIFTLLFGLSCTLSGTDLKLKREKLLDRINFDEDIRKEFDDLLNTPSTDLESALVGEIIRKHMQRKSTLYGFILEDYYTSQGFNHIVDELLDAFYGDDNEKYALAVDDWFWHERLMAIGFPPNWPTSVKRYICISGIMGTLSCFIPGSIF